MRDVIMLVVGAAIAESARVVFERLTKRGEKKETRENARSVVRRHMRRVVQQIDGLDTYVRFRMRPGLEHVKMVRRVLGERDTVGQHMENIGDANLEREVRDWFQGADNALQFAEDYVSGDTEAPRRYGVDWDEWNRRWDNQYALHMSLILAEDRIGKVLEGGQ